MTFLCKLSQTPLASDTIVLDISYAFITPGDNADTEVTSFTDTITVDTETTDLAFTITTSTMNGEVGATSFMFKVVRNSTGGGADSYDGDWEVFGMQINKV